MSQNIFQVLPLFSHNKNYTNRVYSDYTYKIVHSLYDKQIMYYGGNAFATLTVSRFPPSLLVFRLIVSGTFLVQISAWNPIVLLLLLCVQTWPSSGFYWDEDECPNYKEILQRLLHSMMTSTCLSTSTSPQWMQSLMGPSSTFPQWMQSLMKSLVKVWILQSCRWQTWETLCWLDFPGHPEAPSFSYSYLHSSFLFLSQLP